MRQREISNSPNPARVGGIFRNPVFQFIIIMGLTVVLRLPLLNIPFDRDEGGYAYIGWRMGLHELPYRDWVDLTPPGIFWMNRVALWLPLNPVCAVHLVAALFAGASAGVLFLIARRFLGIFWSLAAGILLGLLSADPAVQGSAASTELFMQLPVLLSLLALFRAVSDSAHRRTYMVLCGALAGVAALFKQAAVFNWIFLVLIYPTVCERANRKRMTVAFAGWSALGAAVVWSGVTAYFFVSHGGVEFIQNVFLRNLENIGVLSPADRLARFDDSMAAVFKTQAVLWLFAIIGAALLWNERRKKWSLFLLLWMMTSAVGVNANGYFLPHYFQALLPPLALAAALGASRLNQRLLAFQPEWRGRALLVLAMAALPAAAIWPFLFRYTPKQSANRIYPGNPFAEMPELALRLAEVTRPEDRVYVFGSEPELLFYARRASATRHIFLFPLFGPYSDALEKQTKTSVEIARARPAAAYYTPNEVFFLPHREKYLTGWSFDYIHKNFHPDRWLGTNAAGSFELLTAASSNVVGELLVRKP